MGKKVYIDTFSPVFMTIFKQTYQSDKDSAKMPEFLSQAQEIKFIIFPGFWTVYLVRVSLIAHNVQQQLKSKFV